MRRHEGVRALLAGLFAASIAFSYALATTDDAAGSGDPVGKSLGSTLGTSIPLDIGNGSNLGVWIVGTRSAVQFWGVGGVKPYKFSSTNVPSVLTLTAAGRLSGVFGSADVGLKVFNVTITDMSGSSGQKTKLFSITVQSTTPSKPEISLIDLPGQGNSVTLGGTDVAWQLTFPQRATGTTVAQGAIPLGIEYAGKLDAVGGQPFGSSTAGFYYDWSVAAGGALPTGLNLNGNGTVFGIPYKKSETRTFRPTLVDSAGTAEQNPVPAGGIQLLTGETGTIGSTLGVLASKANFTFGASAKDSLALSGVVNANGSSKANLAGATCTFLWGGAFYGPFTFDAKSKISNQDAGDLGIVTIAVTPNSGKMSVKIKKATDLGGQVGITQATPSGDSDVSAQLTVGSSTVSIGGTNVIGYVYTARSGSTPKGTLLFKLGKTGAAQGGLFQIVKAKIADKEAGSIFNISFLLVGFEGDRIEMANGSTMTLVIQNKTFTLTSNMFTVDARGGVKLNKGAIAGIKKFTLKPNGVGAIQTDVLSATDTTVPQAASTTASQNFGMGIAISNPAIEATTGAVLIPKGRNYTLVKK